MSTEQLFSHRNFSVSGSDLGRADSSLLLGEPFSQEAVGSFLPLAPGGPVNISGVKSQEPALVGEGVLIDVCPERSIQPGWEKRSHTKDR